MTESRWIFFDLGWTLVDETNAHLERLRNLRSAVPRLASVGDAEFLRMCEEQASRFAASPFLAALQSVDPEAFESARPGAWYDHRRECLFAGVPETLRDLKASFRLGLIANQSAGTEGRLVNFGIRELFDVVVASTEAGLAKPDPRIFERAQSLAGCLPHQATMVGDRLDNDIGPAKNCGWRTVRVLQGFSRRQVPRSPAEAPDVTLDSVRHLSSGAL
jgi:HAD superfamily hydrolase (TIGR01509 family)